jgi:cytochrome P450/ferredoxin-NADP reductase
MSPRSSSPDSIGLAGRGPRPDDPSVYYDPLSYAAYDHPFELYRELRDRAPVYYSADRDLWVVSRYADVRACLRDHVNLVNALGNDIDGTHDSYGVGMLVCQDPPRHTVLRDAIRRTFGGREIQALEPETRATARRLISEFRAKGGGDLIPDVVLPLVFDVSMRLVGLPSGDAPYFAEHLLRAMVRTVGEFGVPADAVAANQETEEHIAQHVDRRRAEMAADVNRAGSDAITQILLAVEEGKVHPAEIVGLTHLVLGASTDAPAALLSDCVAVLDRLPGLQEHLAEHPEKIANFVEEVLRFETPAQNLCRQSVAEFTIEGTTIPANSRVMVLLASGNRDERAFADPDHFDVDREFGPDTKTLAFGEGIHSCMGAPVARLTGRVMVEELIAAGNEIRIVGSPERWVKQMVRGYSRLPVRFPRRLTEGTREIQATHHKSTRLTLESGWSISTGEAAPPREFEAEVRVASKTAVADGVVALTLRGVDGSALPRWDAGAHVDLVIEGVATRQYSLCGSADDPETYRLGILRDPKGSGGSMYVHDVLSEGDLVRVRGPRNNFALVDSPRYLFIAGGIGITPILPMIAAAEKAGAEWHLLYGGRSRTSMAFLDELAPHGDRVAARPQDEYGLLDLAAYLGEPRGDTKVYCCGPEPLLAAVEAQCRAWPRRTLHVERFVPKPLTEPLRREAFEVRLERSDQTFVIPPERSILDVLQEAGVAVLSSCKEGTCGTCETAVLGGEPDHRDSVLDEEDRASGDTMMICVSRAASGRLVLDL